MPTINVRLDGQGPDKLSVGVILEIDPHLIWGKSGNQQGRGLVVPYESNITVNRHDYQNNSPSVFDHASGQILHISGYVANQLWSKRIGDEVPFTYSNPPLLYLPLSDSDIQTLDENRTGEKLTLSVSLTALVQVSGELFALDNKNVVTPSCVVRVHTMSTPVIEIPRDAWIDILNQLGKTIHLVELPAPEIDLKAPWDPVTKQYKMAVQAYREGRYEQAVGECRQVVEGIATIVSQQWNISRANGRSFANWVKEVQGRLQKAAGPSLDEQDQAEMLGTLLTSTWSWTSPSHHFSLQVSQRDGARFTLSLVSSLLDIVAQVLTAHPRPLKEADENGGGE